MNPIIPYLFFNGDCRAAMDFYRTVFGGDLQMMTYGQAPPGHGCPASQADRIMHAMLTVGELMLMASDTPEPEAQQARNTMLNIQCTSAPEIEKLFAALSAGGKVLQPLQDMFWNARFGMVTDRFGTGWMLSYPLP